MSVIVPVGGSDAHLLARQLDRLALQQRDFDGFEVVVGDNAGRLDIDRARWPWVRVVDASERRGAAYARNCAADVALGDVLLFCDADDLVGPDWVAQHVAALEKHRLTAGALRVVDERDPLIDGIASGSTWPSGGFSDRLWRHEGVPIAPSGNMGLRRSIWELVGGFPMTYLRSQDVALSLALRECGVEPHFVPGAELLYVKGRPTRDQRRRIGREIGEACARLHDDFGVGPGPGRLLARAAGRTARSAILTAASGRRVRRTVGAEFAELVGIAQYIGSKRVLGPRSVGAEETSV